MFARLAAAAPARVAPRAAHQVEQDEAQDSGSPQPTAEQPAG
jgi:hypothetical protein